MDRQVSYSVASFAAKFCNELGTNRTTVCSPLSAELVLALLALGCRNQSRAELLQALGVTDDEAIRSKFSFLTSTLKSIRKVTLNVANKVYVKEGGELKPGIKKDAEEVFQSSLGQLDFSDGAVAAGKINDWVAKKTNNKINDMVSPVTGDIHMVLVNAIYFQGLWSTPFDSSSTSPGPFHVSRTKTIQVPMMSTTEEPFDYGVSEALKAKLLKMKYKGKDSSMIIVLPDDIDGLKPMLRKIAAGHNIMADVEAMRSTDCDVMIPKFRVETSMDLKEILPKLGIKSIFDSGSADIDMLMSGKKLFVSEAFQKVLIIVDENGTEAAAASMFDEVDLCEVYPESFVADRPFLYLLTARQIPLFIGVFEGSDYARKSLKTKTVAAKCYKASYEGVKRKKNF